MSILGLFHLNLLLNLNFMMINKQPQIFDLLGKLIKLIKQGMAFLTSHLLAIIICLIAIALISTLWAKSRSKRMQKRAERHVQKIYDHETKKEAKHAAKTQAHYNQSLIAACDQVISLLNEQIEVDTSPSRLVWLRNQYNGLWQSLDHHKPVLKTPQELLNNYERWYPETESHLYAAMQHLNDLFNRFYQS